MAHSTVADLSIDEFKSLIREVVAQTLVEMLGDPDEGLQLRDALRIAETMKMVDIATVVRCGLYSGSGLTHEEAVSVCGILQAV